MSDKGTVEEDKETESIRTSSVGKQNIYRRVLIERFPLVVEFTNRANARNVRVLNTKRCPIYVFNSVVNTKLR